MEKILSSLNIAEWLTHFVQAHSTAGALLVLALVAFTGLALGGLRVRGVGLGIAGILFSGILFGHLGVPVSHEVLEFARDAGLILFVYTIGIQVGPGFLASLRKQGLVLNLLAISVVALGAGIALLFALLGKVNIAVAVGLFAGATTNTPSLGAAQEAIRSVHTFPPAFAQMPALGYAVTYPFGIVGIILTMLVLRAAFGRSTVGKSGDATAINGDGPSHVLHRRNIVIENIHLEGIPLHQLANVANRSIAISRIRKRDADEVSGVTEKTVLNRQDVILAVGTPDDLDKFCREVGRPANVDLMTAPSHLTYRKIIVTKSEVLGKSLRELGLGEKYNVTVTRLTRSNLELTAHPGLHLHFGDLLHVVGEEKALHTASKALGNSVEAMNVTDLLPNLLGIALGIILGNIPIPIPGLPAPLTLGIAGGPLLVAIFLSRVGCIGRLRWYLPGSVNSALREFGIAIFLASVGLMAGGHFVAVLLNGDGAWWMAYGAAITVLPLLFAGLLAHYLVRLSFPRICGLLAGSMTDPPALAFASAMADSGIVSETYAAVYPLTMTMRILVAQALVLFFASR